MDAASRETVDTIELYDTPTDEIDFIIAASRSQGATFTSDVRPSGEGILTARSRNRGPANDVEERRVKWILQTISRTVLNIPIATKQGRSMVKMYDDDRALPSGVADQSQDERQLVINTEKQVLGLYRKYEVTVRGATASMRDRGRHY